MKRLSICLLALLFCFTAVVPAFAEEETAVGKISEVERILYGTEQKGSLVERTDSIEEDINGSVTDDAILTRIDRIHSYVKGRPNASAASFLIKLNMIEWAFTKNLSEGPAKSRLENTEKLLNGRPGVGALDDRISVLMAMVFPGGELEVKEVVLPKDTLIKISIAQALDSKSIQEGDKVRFRAEDSIYIGDVLVIPKGALGNGVVSKVSRARNFGRNGKVEIDYTDIKMIDNNEAFLVLGKLARKETENMAYAAGASVAGMIILGPFGVIGGAFVKGKEYRVPEGALLYVQTREDAIANGVVMPEELKAADKEQSNFSGDGGGL
ncbi:MAG: hypothetical protein LBO03_04875 [Acidaminococcales bacterium]|nr:hypothetical protein [Acidaminococcales bacterium]